MKTFSFIIFVLTASFTLQIVNQLYLATPAPMSIRLPLSTIALLPAQCFLGLVIQSPFTDSSVVQFSSSFPPACLKAFTDSSLPLLSNPVSNTASTILNKMLLASPRVGPPTAALHSGTPRALLLLAVPFVHSVISQIFM